MTREEVIARILQNSNIENMGDVPFGTSPVETLEDYPYSLPAGGNGSFKVANAGGAAMASAQSYGGTRGGGFMFPSLNNAPPVEEYEAEDAAAENAAEQAAEQAAAQAAQKRQAQQLAKPEYQSKDITFEKPQAQAQEDFEALKMRGAKAIEELHNRRARSEDTLTAAEMANASEARQMEMGRFSENAIQETVRQKNPTATEPVIQSKAREIAEKIKYTAEPINERDFEIKYGDWRNEPSLELPESKGRGKTQVASTGRNFADVSSIKNTERTIEGSGSVGLNKPIKDNRNIVQRALDYLSKPQAAQDITIGLLAGSNFGQPAQAVMPDNVVQFPSPAKAVTPSSSGGNVLQFPMRQAAGINPFAGDIVDQMSKLAKPLDMSGMQRTGYTFNPVKWNSDSRSVDAITSAAPKIPAVSVPSLSSTIKSAAESVVSKLNAAKTNTQKLTTKEKRLGGL